MKSMSKIIGLALFIAMQSVQIANAQLPSYAECAARYDHFEDYVLKEEFPGAASSLPFDYELRAMASRLLAEQLGEPTEWADAADLPDTGPLIWTKARIKLDECDRTMGFKPRTLGGKMFGYRNLSEIEKPDNLACYAMLTTLNQQEITQAMNGQLKGASKLFDLRAERTLGSLYKVGWTNEQTYSVLGPIYERFARRIAVTDPVNPKRKLSNDGDIPRFARACAVGYLPLRTRLADIPVEGRERYCQAQRRKIDVSCDDAFSKALAD